jgi:hypothetical protein
MKRIEYLALLIILGLTIGILETSFAGSCIPTPVSVTVETVDKTFMYKGTSYPIKVSTYRAETDVFVATWVEEGDPAYELELQNKRKSTQCKIKVEDLPFLSFEGDFIYHARDGEVVIIMQGISSNSSAAVYETSTCKRIGYIEDLFPEEEYAPVRIGPDSTISFGINNTTYDLGDNCVPVLIGPKN